MSVIDKLTYQTTIDPSGWGKGLSEGQAKFDKFNADVNAKLSKMSVPAPKIEAPKSGAGAEGNPSADLAATILPLAGKIQSALLSAFAPLNGFAAKFSGQFDKVGATIIAISARIDSHLKFPTFQAGITNIRNSIKTTFAESEGRAKQFATVVDRGLGFVQLQSKVSSFIGSIGGLNAKMGEFSKLKAPNLSFDNSSKSITNITNVTKGATQAFKGLGVQIALALGAFGLVFKGVQFLKDGIAGATNLNETISKTDAVLDDASGGVKKFADEMASKFGLVKGEVLDVASGIGGLGKGLGGLSGAGLEKFTTDFTKLAADLSSFKNISLQEAGKALQVGLSGEQSDQLKQLGVVMTEATVKAFAYANGIAKVGHELTEQEKLTARAGVIQKALADASGDLDKTAGGTANQFRKFTGTITNLGTTIGTALLPIIDKSLGLLNTFADYAGKAFGDSQGPVSGFVDKVTTGLDYVSAAFNNWDATVEVVKLSIAEKLNQLVDIFAVVGPNVANIGKYIADNWLLLIGDAFDGIMTGLQNLWKNFQSIGDGIIKFLSNPTGGFEVNWTPILDGFEATAAKLPEVIKPVLTDMSREIADASKPIFDEVQRKAEAAKAKAAAVAKAASAPGGAKVVGKDQLDAQKDLESFAKSLKDKVQSPISKYIEDIAKIDEAQRQGLINGAEARKGKLKAGEDAGFGGPVKLAGALSAGSTEARSAILGAINGKGSNTLEEQNKQIAANTKQALVLQAQMIAALNGMAKPQVVRM